MAGRLGCRRPAVGTIMGSLLPAIFALLLGVGDALALVQAATVSAGTDTCVADAEPNDAPEQAPASAGPTCFAGTLPSGDQDLLLWEVTQADARTAWTIAVNGAPGARTIVELRPVTSEPGVQPPDIGSPLVVITVPQGSDEPVALTDLLLAPGRYLVAVSAGGQPPGPDSGLAYQITLEPQAALPPSGDTEPNDDAQTASPANGAFSLTGDLQGSPDAYRWTIGPDTTTEAWTLHAVTQLGASMTLNLAAADGAQILRAQSRDGRIELPDLVLASGDYLITLDPPASAPSPYVLSAQAISVPLGDPEPNDDQARAVPMAGAKFLAKGRLARDQDEDWFQLTVTGELAQGTVDIRMVWASDVGRKLCLYAPDGTSLLCRESADGILVSGLSLSEGGYALRISGAARPDDPYLVRVDPAGTGAPDFEREPNDAPEVATPIDPSMGMRGRAVDGDVDHFRVRITGEPQLWQVDATGTGIAALDWIRLGGERLAGGAVSDDRTSATLTDLYLIPGEHWLRVEADDGNYTLALTPLGPPDPNAEREPNDLPAREEQLVVGRPRSGRLPTATDTDVYRFTVSGTDHLVLNVEAPADGGVEVHVIDDVSPSRTLHASADEPVRYDLAPPVGDVRVFLLPTRPSAGHYAIGLERADPFLMADDQEPNDSPRTAREMPADGTVAGTASGDSDSDWYRLPASTDGAPLRVIAEGDVTALAVSDGTNEQTLFAESGGTTYASGPLVPGVPLFLRVSTIGPYTVRLADAAPVPPAPDTLPASVVTAELVIDDATVAAFWPTGQRLSGQLRLTNPGPVARDVELDWAASDRTWRIDLPSGHVALSAGASTEMDLAVLLPPDVPADAPVRVTIRAREPDGAGITTFVDLNPSRDALPSDQVRAWRVPEALLGGLDAASLALGAVPLPSLDADGEARLHDGFAASDWGLSWPIGGLPVTLAVDLATDEPVPVAGAILHPLSEDLSMGDAVRRFELALSLDGATWETALSGELVRSATEQAFVLPAPIPARYAQLRVTSVQRDTLSPSRIDLGEWKVVATPGWAPLDGSLDIAEPLAGGHVVWMLPQPGSAEQAGSILTDEATTQLLAVAPGSRVEWVIGFMDDRAARISSLEWRDPVPSDPSTRLRRVDVAVSLDSPLGPWRSLGTWQLERAADGTVKPFAFEAPTWARFLRFGGTVGGKQAVIELPDRIRVLEAPQDDTYRSVLGQWGMGERAGPFEWGSEPPALPLDEEGDPGDSAERPRLLAEGEEAGGRVHFGADSDWYLLSVPDGGHTLAVTVGGLPSVGVGVMLTSEAGERVSMSFGPGEVAGTVTYLAPVEPGSSYRLEVTQPPSSIAVTFDSSASVATQLDAVEAGLRAFAQDMVPGREALRILPFDDQPLLPDWADDPYEIADAVGRFILGPSSSRVESNLRNAALDLASREGGRAILLVTDAASSAFDQTAKLWSALASTRPLVFTVEVGGEGESPAIERHHLMADWAASAGGVASHARGGIEVQQAFDRLATWLRRPVAYTLAYRTSPDELPPPEPGHISVLAPEVDGRRPAILGGDVAIELVVDTSGSMLERLGDQSRIDIARTVLTELLRDDIPPGVLVALRTFTPKARSCETRLVTPLSPLDPPAMVSTIRDLKVPRLAHTPLARAIAAVADDLADVTGPRIVVVMSDGKESCKGDPAAEVRRLRAQGFDITVNVVGLALDKRSRKTIARLADLGGGSYFDAGDAETLGAALRAAVSAPVQVLDSSGGIVARGTVGGEPIEVPVGRYRVVALTDPVFTFEDVFVEPEAALELTLPVNREQHGATGRAAAARGPGAPY